MATLTERRPRRMGPDDKQEEFKEMELWEHLAELRTRLIRSALYVMVGMVVAWAIYDFLFGLLQRPLAPLLAHPNIKMVFGDIKGPFYMRFHVSIIGGIIMAVPLVMMELWGFISPGLTRKERKAFYVVVPLALAFFFGGVVTGYFLLNPIVAFFVGFLPQDTELYQDPVEWISFVSKMVLAFGLTFQLPIVLMFLGYVGIISSEVLIKGWRWAIVVNFLLAALITPTPDAFNMSLLAAPLMFLYVAGIGMVKFVERIKRKQDGASGYA